MLNILDSEFIHRNLSLMAHMNICILEIKKHVYIEISMKYQPDIKSEQEGNEDSWNDYVP